MASDLLDAPLFITGVPLCTPLRRFRTPQLILLTQSEQPKLGVIPPPPLLHIPEGLQEHLELQFTNLQPADVDVHAEFVRTFAPPVHVLPTV